MDRGDTDARAGFLACKAAELGEEMHSTLAGVLGCKARVADYPLNRRQVMIEPRQRNRRSIDVPEQCSDPRSQGMPRQP